MSGEKRKENTSSDAFLSSMTFATGGLMRTCDCDECDFIPTPIADAIRQHKRMRTQMMTRTQDRSLVARADSVSVWTLTMPIDAEPLIEFGNSHRIVLIDRLSPVRSAGKFHCRSTQAIVPYDHFMFIAIKSRDHWERRPWIEK